MTTFKPLFWLFAIASLFLSFTSMDLHASGDRDYYRELTKTELSDLRYVLTTLAKSKLTTLLRVRSKLQEAGDRIDHIHPLRFMLTCFSDEELKGCLHSVYDRGGKVWSKFYDEIKKNFNDEANRNNLDEEYIKDFAKQLDIKPSLINSALQKKQWDTFMELLIKNIPRGGEPDRYDM